MIPRRVVEEVAESAGLSPRELRGVFRIAREPAVVEVDGSGMRRIAKSGCHEIRWADVRRASVIVLPRRFSGQDVLLTLAGGGVGMIVRHEDTPSELLAVMGEALPGFDVDGFADAFQSYRPGTARHWQRDG